MSTVHFNVRALVGVNNTLEIEESHYFHEKLMFSFQAVMIFNY